VSIELIHIELIHRMVSPVRISGATGRGSTHKVHSEGRIRLWTSSVRAITISSRELFRLKIMFSSSRQE